MARKKKQTRKQKIAQRRAAIARKRQKRRGKPRQGLQLKPDLHVPAPSFTPRESTGESKELLDDVLPLFPKVGETHISPEGSMKPLMMSILGSEKLIEEPEFEDIILEPLLCAQTFIEVAEELGVDPDSLSRLPDDEREDTHLEILERTAQQLLTDELRQDILEGLDKLRLRLKKSGQQKKVPQVAALQMFLGGEGGESQELWPMIGLVQAIIQRSLEIGFELGVASADIMDMEGIEEGDSPLEISEKVAASSVGQKLTGLLSKIPGLGGFLEKKADEVWDEGMHALYMGDLNLGLFTPDELGEGVEILNKVMTEGLSQDVITSGKLPPRLVEERSVGFVIQIDKYITELATPELMERVRERIEAAALDPDYKERWSAFIFMLVQYFVEETAETHDEKPFLVYAFMGEMKTMAMQLVEMEEQGEGESTN
jgi:hypothetical protein